MSEAFTFMTDEEMKEFFAGEDARLKAACVGYDKLAAEPDAVKHPSHYCKGGIECIDAIRASMSREAFCGYCKGNSLKYLWRYEHKGRRVEDLEKAHVYLGWLIDEEKKACA